MITTENTDLASRTDSVLRPLGITHNMKPYRILCDCVALIHEQEDRMEAVQKEIYLPIAESFGCKWTAVQSAIRRAVQTAWHTNPALLQQMAGYPLDGCPTAVQFLEIVYVAVIRG